MKLQSILNLMQKLAVKISVEEPKFCGGVPRDKFMNRLENISDLDFTNGNKSIDYLSSEFFNVLKKKFNVTKKIMSDGHSSIYLGNTKFDFSSNFNVPEIEKILHARGINNPTDMQKEIYSRDFTCNALLLSLDLKELIDITSQGCTDIKDKKIKTCLSPEITLINSRNRVIRAIYLACKLDFDIDDKIINFVSKNPESIKIASEKTLIEKLNLSFEKDADKANYLINKMGLWNYIPITESAKPYYAKNVKNNVKQSF